MEKPLRREHETEDEFSARQARERARHLREQRERREGKSGLESPLDKFERVWAK
jgi:hypothetical protein